MEQHKNKINEVMDANKENREISTILVKDSTSKSKQMNPLKCTTLLRIQSKTKIVPLNSVGNSLADGAKSTSQQTKTIDSCSLSRIKPTQPVLKKTSISRKSMTKWKRDSLTLNVNPLPKKALAHPTKSIKRKSIQSKLPHKGQVIVNEATAVNGGNSKKTFAVPSDKFPCNLCKKTFFFKTTLEAHKKSHADLNLCQYCQRTFALPATLLKHLKEHCQKISIAERKKLLAAHEKTPDLDRTSHRISQKTPNSVKHSTDALLEFVSRSCSVSQSNQLKASIEYYPPIKGVYQTPKKLIKCYKCGENFKHAFLFATHAELCAEDSK